MIMILPTWWNNSYAKYDRDFRQITLRDIEATLKFPAPTNIFIVYRLSGGYRLINNFFWEKINLQLNQCKAHKEIVEPVKNKIIEEKISWWQEEKFIFVGGSIIFILGASLGAYVRGK